MFIKSLDEQAIGWASRNDSDKNAELIREGS